ncbi:Transcription initiation factor TFIID component TAF4 [Macleaya cordata]|uniref:Transcription initiation factor TFIID component TAF4 n=1 Tax=Macleaya cordata TaxID=56857 RepID=A0A200R2Y8_MACCD|nr:Transcription initiation factor TFIID component TAF4 [Macleaya cordata]
MDPSIMKLLDDDEDETIHSGADVEAFTAALNRDIKGETSTSQPLDSGTGAMSHGNNPTSSQLFVQWQNSIKSEENVTSQNQQEGLKNLQPQEQQRSSETDLAQHGSSADSQQQQSSSSMEHCQVPVQQNQSHDDQLKRQAEQNAPQFSQKNAVQISEQNTAHMPEQQDRMRHPDSQHPFPKLQKMNNQQAPQVEQANNPLSRNKQVPFGMLLPAILPHLDKDRAMQLQTLFTKLRSNEINKDGFVRLMRSIVGDKMLRMAVHAVQTQEMAKDQAARNSQTGPHQFQKGLRAPADPSQVPSSTVQLQTDPSLPTTENSSQKSTETEHQSDSQGMHVNQMSSASMSTVKQEREHPAIPLRGINKQQQQQQHLHFSQTPFPVYGANMSNYHPHGYSAPPVSAGLPSLKPHTQDSQMRQVPLHHGMGSTQAAGASQPMNVMNASKYEIQTSASEPKRFHGGPLSHSTSHPTMQNNVAQWQPMNKEQKISALSSMACVKQEVVDQTQDQQHKSQFSTSLGSSSFGAGQLDQGNTASPGTSKDEMMEKQSSRNPFSTSTTTVQTNSASVSMASQVDPTMVVPSTTTPLGAVTNVKTPPKKPTIGQKKPLDALGTPSPAASKKQKVSGAFLDQSIEQLNDVTAVSGVNLREEEEQLLSGPKEESRASEATRRVVQEEEERLILQKNPLQKKLAKIMSKCGIRSRSNDVERCLSLCVEERMRGLISNLIRLSKQRVDIERPRHRTIITSDVRRQILLMNRRAKEDWEKKQAEEAEKLRKLNEAEGNGGADGEKDKDEGRSKALKANKEEDDKMRTTAANVAARVAVGGDDMLSKWQLMAEQARQKREGGADVASAAQSGKDASRRPLSTSGRSLRDNQGAENRGPSAGASGAMRKFGRDSVMAHTKIARSISIKDVIAVLEREPQMSKSTLIYRLYDKMCADAAPE